MAEDMYWIWSGQWNAWWRPKSSGYTMDRLEAGQYSKDEAEGILRGVGPEKQLKMVKVDLHPFDDKAAVYETLALISDDLGLDTTKDGVILPAKPERIYQVFKELLLRGYEVERRAREVSRLSMGDAKPVTGIEARRAEGGEALVQLKDALDALDEAKAKLGVS